jgi:glycosyltransferase involved in cell wall biosynthesis
MDRSIEPLDALVVAQPATYGVAVCVRQLVEAAVTAGHRVTVACPGESVGPLAAWVRAAGAEVAQLDMRREPAPRDAMDAVTLRRLMRGRDLVHLHSSKAAALGRVAAASLGRRRPAVIVTPHAWSWLVGGRMTPAYRTIERQLARWSDGLVAVSEEEAAEGRRALGSAGDRIRVIVNGVDRERFSPQGSRADRPVDGPLLLCVGRLCEQKGQDLGIQALAMLRERRARLRFVGGEDQIGDRARLQALAASLGVSDRVEWVDHTDDVAAHLRAADLMVAPSRWEGMSLVLLEALACGLPVVATRVAGSEAVGEAGAVVPVEDPSALAAAIDPYLTDVGALRRASEMARARSAGYDLTDTLRRNLDLWSELVGARRLQYRPTSRGG